MNRIVLNMAEASTRIMHPDGRRHLERTMEFFPISEHVADNFLRLLRDYCYLLLGDYSSVIKLWLGVFLRCMHEVTIAASQRLRIITHDPTIFSRKAVNAIIGIVMYPKWKKGVDAQETPVSSQGTSASGGKSAALTCSS